MFILPYVWIELVVHYIYTHNKNTKADRPKLQVKRTPCGMCPSVSRSGKSIVFVYVTTDDHTDFLFLSQDTGPWPVIRGDSF
jgi:Tol biopolymer transport system component